MVLQQSYHWTTWSGLAASREAFGVLEVETTHCQVRIHEEGPTHALLQGRKRRSVLPGHRQLQRAARHQGGKNRPGVTPGLSVATRPLGVYELVAHHLGAQR